MSLTVEGRIRLSPTFKETRMQSLTSEQYLTLAQLTERYRQHHDRDFKLSPRRNPQMTVDMLCFQVWEDVLCGVLLTPIALSAALVPAISMTPPAHGEQRLMDLPGGRYPFVAEVIDSETWLWRCELLDDLSDLTSLEEANRLAQYLANRVMTSSKSEEP